MQRFRFDHLAPEERVVARRVYFGVLALYCSAILLLGAAFKLSAPSSNAAAARHSGGLFSAVAAERPDLADCAARDLKVLTAIGEHGEAQDVPGDVLAAAFFSLVKARTACAAGNTTEARAIYESITVVPGRSAKK